MHDFDHPGRNNQFLVATNSPLVKAFFLIIDLIQRQLTNFTENFNLGIIVQ